MKHYAYLCSIRKKKGMTMKPIFTHKTARKRAESYENRGYILVDYRGREIARFAKESNANVALWSLGIDSLSACLPISSRKGAKVIPNPNVIKSNANI